MLSILEPASLRADALLSAVVLPSATETDALSTALLVLGAEGHDTMAGLRDGMRTLVMQGGRGRSAFRVRTSGWTSAIQQLSPLINTAKARALASPLLASRLMQPKTPLKNHLRAV